MLPKVTNNLMYAMQVDQDINCRTVGRCTYGATIDRELKFMIPMDSDGKIISLSNNTSRPFFVARYNADLSREGLDAIGLSHIDSITCVKWIQ